MPRAIKQKQSFCAAICGRRESGKTHLCLRMLRSKFFEDYHFEFIVIFSPTMALQKEPWLLLKPTGILIVPRLSERVIRKLLKYQSLKSKSSRGHILIITDDIGMSARGLAAKTTGSALDLLAFNGRHYNISVLSLCQRWSQLTTGFRSQLDFFLWSASSNKKEIESIYQEYSDCDTIIEFKEKIRKTFMKKYTWLYFRNMSGKMCLTEL